MKIAVYSITRERFEYTKTCFQSLVENAGYPFDHFIVDNGSKDATVEYLSQYQLESNANNNRVLVNRNVLVTYFPENVGISKASNFALHTILNRVGNYDLVIKCDNDCLVQSQNILRQIAEIYEDCSRFGPKYILSPKVNGIVNQPTRGRYTQLAGRRIGLTAIVGGLFHCVPAAVYTQYRYPENLPLARGQDDHFCNWAKNNGCEVGYIEGLEVEHYEGTDAQALRYPDYFKRKHQEELLTSSEPLVIRT